MRSSVWTGLLCGAMAVLCFARPGTVAAQPSGGESFDYESYSDNGTARAPRNKSQDQLQRERAQFQAQVSKCDAGDQRACTMVGEAYEYGRGVEQNRPIAAILYKEACEADNATGCLGLGRLTSMGNFPNRDERATVLYERSCELGSQDACTALAGNLEGGVGTARDVPRAETLLRTACASQGGWSCLQFAEFLFRRDNDTALEEAISVLEGNCRSGALAACDRVLQTYYWDAPPRFLQPEITLLYDGCVLGGATFCRNLGDRVFIGQGTAPDPDYAFEAYERACGLEEDFCGTLADMRTFPQSYDDCSRGDAAACLRLGEIYLRGRTVYRDDAAAQSAFGYACDEGLIAACKSAGELLWRLNPDPLSVEAAASMAYLQRACDADDIEACNSLASALEFGTSVPMDEPRAMALYVRVCEAGRRSACKKLEERSQTDPEASLALAGSIFSPPLTPEEEQALIDEQVEANRRFRESLCRSSTLTFRGREYFDELCDNVNRVLRGRPVEAGTAPWQALFWRPLRIDSVNRDLLPQERVLCGGSVIADGWILTAAHCLSEDGKSILRRGYRLRLGVSNPRLDEGMSYPIEEIVLHPQYDRSDNYAYDIALVRYNPRRGRLGTRAYKIARIDYDKVGLGFRPIRGGMPVYTFGWGRTDFARSSSAAQLQSGRLELSSPVDCERILDFEKADPSSILCAAGRGGQQACYGDSGGPLIYYGDADKVPRVIAVVSSGRSCGTTGEESRYTRVAAVLPWIEETLQGVRQ